MERKVKRVIGYFLLAIVGLIEATEWITVVHEHIPHAVADHINQPIALAIFIVGILFLFLARTGDEEKTPAAVPERPAQSSTITPTISPTISPNITVINHPPALTSQTQETPAVAPRQEQRHNVQYIRIQEYPATDEQPLALAACFENVPIPHRSVPTWNYVKVRADYKDFTTGRIIMSIYPNAWMAEDEAEVFMTVGKPFYAAIAINENRKWSAVEVTKQNNHWGTMHGLRPYNLPEGDLMVVITLVGDRGASIEPERFHLRIWADGTATVRRLPHEPEN